LADAIKAVLAMEVATSMERALATVRGPDWIAAIAWPATTMRDFTRQFLWQRLRRFPAVVVAPAMGDA
jgi:hypothetical protein